MNLVPIPHSALQETEWAWLPFLERIAQDAGYATDQLAERVWSGEVQPIVIWDDNAKEPKAFGGMRVFLRGDDRIAEVIWMTGTEMNAWTHLIGDFEDYVRSIGCAGVRMFARSGWKRLLTDYRETHVILDKDF